MGSLLQQDGITPDPHLWMSKINLTAPEKITALHEKYIKAGADIITTNTFRTNPVSVQASSTRITSKNLVEKSVALAKKACGSETVIIAGANPPAEDCYQIKRSISKKELERNHFEHIDSLMNAGCDFILNETQSHFDEIKIITSFCHRNTIPFVLSLFFTPDLKLLSGHQLFDTLTYAQDFGPLAVGLNCVMPSVFQKALKRISALQQWGFYLNCGTTTFNNENIHCGVSPETYTDIVKKSLSKKPSFIGACCGSSPLHIKNLKDMLDEKSLS